MNALANQAHDTDSDFVKHSFLKLPVPVDVEALLEDYRSIPSDAWSASHWSKHCSSTMLLLRGGRQGTHEDFTTCDVVDHECLKQLPYISSLIDNDGAFGEITYAFIFRMKPMGVARPHTDDNPAWKTPFRVHVPITTNDEAMLLSEKRGKHFEVGEVWTFDNQAEHAVVNGGTVRAHLIFDVQPNPKLRHLLDNATYDPGTEEHETWRRAALPDAPPVLSFAHAEPLSITEKKALGLRADGFASRITGRRPIARLRRVPVQIGDIVYSVNGVDECEVARTALDYIYLRHNPGDTIRIGVLRDNDKYEESVHLYENVLPESVRRAWWRLSDVFR